MLPIELHVVLSFRKFKTCCPEFQCLYLISFWRNGIQTFCTKAGVGYERQIMLVFYYTSQKWLFLPLKLIVCSIISCTQLMYKNCIYQMLSRNRILLSYGMLIPNHDQVLTFTRFIFNFNWLWSYKILILNSIKVLKRFKNTCVSYWDLKLILLTLSVF